MRHGRETLHTHTERKNNHRVEYEVHTKGNDPAIACTLCISFEIKRTDPEPLCCLEAGQEALTHPDSGNLRIQTSDSTCNVEEWLESGIPGKLSRGKKKKIYIYFQLSEEVFCSPARCSPHVWSCSLCVILFGTGPGGRLSRPSDTQGVRAPPLRERPRC